MNAKRLSIFWLLGIVLWAGLSKDNPMNLGRLLEAPNWGSKAILGTDAFGRDLFGALGEAIRRSLLFALISSTLALFFGALVGSGVGILTGKTRFLLERVIDFFLAFPPMLLALAIQAEIGTGWRSLGFSVSFGLFPGVVRFVASRAREIALTDYLISAKALGGGAWGNFHRHYLPEVLAHLRLKAPSLLAQALLLEATLSFLNLGVPAGVLSWGSLLLQAKEYLIESPHIAWVVGPPLVITLLALQSLMDDAVLTKNFSAS